MSRVIAFIATIALISACATQQQQPEIAKIPAGTTVHLDVKIAEAQLPDSPPDAEIRKKNADSSALYGVGAGLTALAVFSLLALPLCYSDLSACDIVSTSTLVIGAAAIGAGSGAAKAASLQLPPEKAENLDFIIQKTTEEIDMAGTLSASIRSSAGQDWKFSDSDALVDISVVVEAIELERHEDEHLSISTITSLKVTDRSGAEETEVTREYKLSSGIYHVDSWIWKDGAIFRDTVEDQMADHAERIVSQLSGQTRAVN